MQYQKFHFILAIILVTSAAITFFALRSQGTTAKRIFFSQDLAKASSETKPLDQVIASAMLENAAEPSQSLTILDSISGVQLEVKILAEQLTYSPQKRIIDYELAIDQPCLARVILMFNNSGNDGESPRSEERRLSFHDCEYDDQEFGTTIRWTTTAPEWATRLDGVVLITNR